MKSSNVNLNAETIITSAAQEAFGKPLVGNAIRSIISEAILNAALGDGWKWASGGWAKCDFIHQDGTCLEVKQSAALQIWHRPGDTPSKGQFDIAPRKGYYDDGSAWVDHIGRNTSMFSHGIRKSIPKSPITGIRCSGNSSLSRNPYYPGRRKRYRCQP